MKIDQLDHVALRVRDVERSAAWYQEVLGLELRYRRAPGDVPVFVCAGSTCIALFRAEPSAPARTESPVHMDHVAFRLTGENHWRAREELRRRGIPFRVQRHPRSCSLYLTDPDGFTLELTTYELSTDGVCGQAPPG